jgi:UDP-glucuronate 4-epimerase
LARALVTGCAGFIGSHLTESLLADGWEVVGVDCFTDNYPRALKQANLLAAREHDRFTLVRADLVTTDAERLLDGVDVIFHLAAEPGVRSSWGRRFDRYLRNNVRATQRLLEASAGTPERRIVYASSSSVYGESERLPTPEDAAPRPLSPYGVTKLAAEQLCRLYHANHGLDTVALRFFSVYGPRQRPDMAFRRFCEAIVAGAPIEVFGDGTQTRDFTHVTDTAAGIVAAGTAPAAVGRTFNLGSGRQVSIAELARLVVTLVGDTDVPVVHAPARPGDVAALCADAAAARRTLDFVADRPLPEGIREIAATLRADRRGLDALVAEEAGGVAWERATAPAAATGGAA